MGRIGKKPPQEEEEGPKYCKACFGQLNEDGFCDRGGGYPWYIPRQPSVCPYCRHRLHWNGNCVHEKGGCWDRYVKEGPGYYHEEINGHWVNTGEKQRMFTKDEHMKKVNEIIGQLSDDKRMEDSVVPF